MAIQVIIKINDKIIEHTFCKNVSKQFKLEYGKGIQVYKQGILKNNKVIDYHKYDIKNHDFDDGHIKLAIKMLENLQNS